MLELADPTTMTSNERMEEIFAMRNKQQMLAEKGEELSIEEMRRVTLLLRADRASSQANARSRSSRSSAPPPSLEDF